MPAGGPEPHEPVRRFSTFLQRRDIPLALESKSDLYGLLLATKATARPETMLARRAPIKKMLAICVAFDATSSWDIACLLSVSARPLNCRGITISDYPAMVSTSVFTAQYPVIIS